MSSYRDSRDLSASDEEREHRIRSKGDSRSGGKDAASSSYERKPTHHRTERTSRHGSLRNEDGNGSEQRGNDRNGDHDRSRRHGRDREDRREREQRSRSPWRKRSYSPPVKKRRRSYSAPRSPPRKSQGPLPSQAESFRGETGDEGAVAVPEKQKPNFKPTGLLAKEANTVAGTTTVLKYHEPPEARKPPPKEQWRMYVFKKKDLLDTIYLHQRSAWLCGRDQKITDLLLEHPSISKQHAVIQFRYITSTNEFGDKSSKVKPYLIDLDSANGTKLNGKAVEGSRLTELLDGDVIAFGDSEREYVIMLPPP
ncbi:hypothetical protein LTR62_003414 [Meristemomyces frigidus]|uniref:FHA domain-containing protein n=1 Tax=Meristemomyces frigidus TaxID=1508187 RepID=A0AAN7TJ04_9PEZI|nr:hypothetical protein LTR62_003414 [Meristemomyces frigidus]